jgi:CRISPR-associated protein Cas2
MDYGQRVQKSVFECTLREADWATLLARLLEEMDLGKDSLRVYHLGGGIAIEHHGAKVPIDLDGPLIV